ncbi:MAG: heme ABC transporter [Methylibium sp. NZG]|nr:MAG: heme ABC transporter [Methylibium sp. NZG]
MTTSQHIALQEAFTAMRRGAKARHRDIAAQLGVSEGELVAAHVARPDEAPDRLMKAQRLRPVWPQIVQALEPVGELLALTRNESCVHEKTGTYANASHSGGNDAKMGLVLGGAIDLRVVYHRWAHGFAIDEATEKGPQRSLQFFDAAGVAIHKVFLRAASNVAAWDALVAAFAAEQQPAGISVQPAPAADAEQADAVIDVSAFRQAWASMRDTHEFFGLLKTHGVSRTQALRLAEPQFAQRVEPDAAPLMLNAAARTGVPIMAFVGNPGMIQIHSGAVKHVVVMGPWLNVLDEGFNLHLRADHIASAWVVGKPTSDGLVTSLELFDATGQTIAMFFGERKPGVPELASWRSLVDEVVRETTPCAA